MNDKLTTADLAASEEADRPVARDTDADDTRSDEAHDAHSDDVGPLMPAEDAERFRSRWHELQASFVDEPRRVVEQADELVAELMRQLAQTFAEERRGLEDQWSRGDDVSTEDLRVALTRYRSFFERLLAT